MAYSTGMLNKRIRIAKRVENQDRQFGEDGQPKYEWLGWFWASEKWNKGAKSLQNGALEAYDVVMFRLRYAPSIDRWCVIWFNGKFYKINNVNEDPQENQIQIIAEEIISPNITIVEPIES